MFAQVKNQVSVWLRQISILINGKCWSDQTSVEGAAECKAADNLTQFRRRSAPTPIFQPRTAISQLMAGFVLQQQLWRRSRDKRLRLQLIQSLSLFLSPRFPIGITACPMFNLQSLLILSVIGIVISGDKEDMKLHNVDGCHSCKSRKDKGGKGLDKTFTIECYGNKPVSFKRF